MQTLYMILGIGLLVGFLFMPFGYGNIVTPDGNGALAPIKALESVGFIIPVSVNIIALLAGIFLFKRASVQKVFVTAGIVLTLALIGMVVYVLVAGLIDVTPGTVVCSITWGGGGLLLVGCLIAEFAALAGINHDQRLLRSYDRLR